MLPFFDVERFLRIVTWHCTYFVEMSITFKPSFDLGSWTVSSVPFIGISGHDLSFLWHRESRFSFNQVSGMSAIIKCHDNLLRRYLLYKFSLLYGWRCSLLILFKVVVVVSKSSALYFWLFKLKLKYLLNTQSFHRLVRVVLFRCWHTALV